MLRRFASLICLGLLIGQANASELEGDYLYHVMTVRAAPGSLSGLLDDLAELRASGYFDDAGLHPPYVMRHTQGDQWDLLLIIPMASFTEFYSEERSAKRAQVRAAYADHAQRVDSHIAFAEDLFALGPPLSVVDKAYTENGFYHVEMFEAVAGKSAELMQQRRMENDYLARTGQVANLVFRRVAGTDVDVFTIGFHESLQSFAKPAPASPAEKDAAAVEAGFESLAHISFYMRSLISRHFDTLAVKVP